LDDGGAFAVTYGGYAHFGIQTRLPSPSRIQPQPG
jgi:hypothetical protein